MDNRINNISSFPTAQVIEGAQLVCPFRTCTFSTQDATGVTQLVTFPPCQLAACPHYNSKGKDNSEKCFLAMKGR